jgi:hypothetical protein
MAFILCGAVELNRLDMELKWVERKRSRCVDIGLISFIDVRDDGGSDVN